jgi:hypothetical protein
VHNLTGAFGRDLPVTNPIVLIANALGYLNLAVAVGALGVLAWHEHARRTRIA